jgi:membrane protease YdiL (CAAX protease family)
MDRPLRVYLWLAFGITWGAGGLGLLAGAFRPRPVAAPMHPLHLLAAFGPSIAGVIMAAGTGGWAEVRRLFGRVVPTWAAVPWYAAVLVGFPAATMAAAWLVAPDSLGVLPPWDRLIPLVPVILVTDTGPIGEEFGWRGFALPRLLQRWSPLRAALILGAIWAAWHLPTFFIPTLSQSQLSIPLFFVNSLALSILMTCVYLKTRGDMLAMILVHLMANYCGTIGIPFPAEVSAEVALAALIVACGGLRAPPGRSLWSGEHKVSAERSVLF